MKGAASNWYMQRITAYGINARLPWANWAAFKTALQAIFQPPNYQHYLRQQI